MTTALPNTASAEVGEVDRSARCALSFVVASALGWLALSGLLAVLNFVQLISPEFMAECPFLTFGHLQAMQETVLIYGWAANAGLAVILWLLARLGGSPLRGTNYVAFGSFFWSVAVLFGVVAIGVGEMTSFSLLQMPRYAQPLMLVAYGAMAMPGVLAWTGRKTESTYATQWYAVAALFLFPWFFSAAQVMLLFAPVRGVLQDIVAAWYGQNVYSLWLAPMALAALYYLLPKLTGRVVPNYDFAIYGFWALLVFGAWMGGRQLVGGPVPAWIPTLAIVSGALLMFHYLIVVLNLRGVFSTGGVMALKFAAFGLAAYLLNGLVEVAFSMRSLAAITQLTYFQQAQEQLALAAYSMVIFAALYYLLPRVTGKPWPSVSLIRAHYLASVLGFVTLVGSLAVAGWQQGIDLNNAKVTIETMTGHVRPWLVVATAAQALLLVGNLALASNFIRLLMTKSSESEELFRQPPALEVSAS